MIARVFGKINDNEVELIQVDEKTWNISIPRVKEGQYYVDLFALDQAGNQAFVATALFVVDANCMVSSFKITDSDKKYKPIFKTDNLHLEVVKCLCTNKQC